MRKVHAESSLPANGVVYEPTFVLRVFNHANSKNRLKKHNFKLLVITLLKEDQNKLGKGAFVSASPPCPHLLDCEFTRAGSPQNPTHLCPPTRARELYDCRCVTFRYILAELSSFLSCGTFIAVSNQDTVGFSINCGQFVCLSVFLPVYILPCLLTSCLSSFRDS